ncbi:efflux RND transporter periplasmic adaptor subunit [Colwellia psychrerythraea]|uniref:Efflux transporter, RND family, MFP subunit n=1 Tax=Colwellia psychrerythraea TaxID=28229 RepID=A0A099L2S7_COLPS|nr:efflux RND transporter periplasmic adaptor subunit [Colwellia psychrerythraea]KGJ96760.1 efflux transporter, RND family, MFP subunit [Colwellia psychrerythraea]
MKPRILGLFLSRIEPVFIITLLLVSTSLITPSYAQQLETKTIKVKPIVKEINRTGKVAFKRTLNLSFKSNGYLEEINVDEGDSFTKGQLLAELDSAELIAEKNASYARLLQAKRDVKRINTLLRKNLSSQQALDNAETLVETTRASHKVAAYNLSKAQLYAPFDGVVITRFTEAGELQSPNQSALQIAAIENNLVVRVALTANEVKLVKLQQKVNVNLPQFGVVKGRVSKVPAIADQQSHLFTIEVLLSGLTTSQVVVGQLAHMLTDVITDTLAYRLPISALNSVDSKGRALIMVLGVNSTQADKYKQQAYVIKQLSNKYIYLSAQQGSLPLTVVTRGWQHIALIERKQLDENQ